MKLKLTLSKAMVVLFACRGKAIISKSKKKKKKKYEKKRPFV